MTDLEKDREKYFDSNANRNPFKNVEFYAIPFAIAAASWILAVIVDKTCSTDICEVPNSTPFLLTGADSSHSKRRMVFKIFICSSFSVSLLSLGRELPDLGSIWKKSFLFLSTAK
jgi:hypothetical protein